MKEFFSYNLGIRLNKTQVIMTEQTASLFTHKFLTDDTQSTSLSIEKTLISDTKALAEELNMPWSRLVALALEELIRRHRGRKNLIDRINAAYADDVQDEEDIRLKEGMRATQRRLLKDETW